MEMAVHQKLSFFGLPAVKKRHNPLLPKFFTIIEGPHTMD
jgi:hypothetical protein